MSHSFTVPVSTKLRLCQPSSKTLDFAKRLEASGASWITLHARHVSARRRRQGAADLIEIKNLKDNLSVPVVSNGNVRVWQDILDNRKFTGADGIMVGETLLGNPWYAVSTIASFSFSFELDSIDQSLREYCSRSRGNIFRVSGLV
jgi:tRNA-dihydrouridine synthase 1